MIDKKQMTEEDIKLRFITPSITAKWNLDHITMETKITDGKINLKGNFVFREKPKKADYVLYINANNPIIVFFAMTEDETYFLYVLVFLWYNIIYNIPNERVGRICLCIQPKKIRPILLKILLKLRHLTILFGLKLYHAAHSGT